MSLKKTLKKAKQIEQQLEQQDATANQNLFGAIKPRNYLALNPLLKKGGIHEKEDIDTCWYGCHISLCVLARSGNDGFTGPFVSGRQWEILVCNKQGRL